ncbi:hypothetical protein [Nonomuraea sp. NPDC050643]|uniref:hypothetical protein n=1 Tax=Nonomuraea sp. NPDC050643 TaxID=3155660 RepID=UPI0033C4C778
MASTVVRTIALASACLMAALGTYTPATDRIPRLLDREAVQYDTRRYGVSQVLMGFAIIFVGISSRTTQLPPALFLPLILVAVVCSATGLWLFFTAVSPRRTP